MLRLAALLLLLVNLLLLAWLGGLLPAGAGQREPERLARQVKPGAIRLLPPASASAPQAAAASSTPGVTSAASAASAANAPAAGLALPASALARATACLEAGPFDSSTAASAERALQQAGVPAGSWRLAAAAAGSAYLVYVGPYPDPATLQAKRDELRQLAVAAYPVDADTGLQPGLSLGRHASAAAADAALAALGRRGVRSARVVAVAGSSPAGSLLRVAVADAALQARLAGLALPGGQGFKACAEPPPAAAGVAAAVAPTSASR